MKKSLAVGLLLGAALVPLLQGCLPLLAAGASGARSGGLRPPIARDADRRRNHRVESQRARRRKIVGRRACQFHQLRPPGAGDRRSAVRSQ
jgi:hypothetical protein